MEPARHRAKLDEVHTGTRLRRVGGRWGNWFQFPLATRTKAIHLPKPIGDLTENPRNRIGHAPKTV
jgi:hypothetical protein